MAHPNRENPDKEAILRELERRTSLLKGNPRRDEIIKELEKRTSLIKKGNPKLRMVKELERRTSLPKRETKLRLSTPTPVRSKDAKNIPTLRNRVKSKSV